MSEPAKTAKDALTKAAVGKRIELTQVKLPIFALCRKLQGRSHKYKRPFFSPHQLKTLLQCIADGTPQDHACRVAGITKASFYQWRKASVEFDEIIEIAKANGIAKRLGIIRDASSRDWRAAAWMLERCHPVFFGPGKQSVEVSNKGNPLANMVAVVLPKKTDSLTHANEVREITERAESQTDTNGDSASTGATDELSPIES